MSINQTPPVVVIGDQNAQMVSQYLPEASFIGGYGAQASNLQNYYNSMYHSYQPLNNTPWFVIEIGSNDYSKSTFNDLMYFRKGLGQSSYLPNLNVIWVLPPNGYNSGWGVQANIIQRVSGMNRGDHILNVPYSVGQTTTIPYTVPVYGTRQIAVQTPVYYPYGWLAANHIIWYWTTTYITQTYVTGYQTYYKTVTTDGYTVTNNGSGGTWTQLGAKYAADTLRQMTQNWTIRYA